MQIYTPSAYLEAKMMAERLWKAAPGMIYVEKLCQSRFPWSKGGGGRKGGWEGDINITNKNLHK